MKILILTKPNSGVDYHRLILPSKFFDLKEGDIKITVSSSEKLTEEIFKHVNIVLFSRECPFNLNQVLEFKNKYEFKIVVDLDDYWKLYPLHFLYTYWQTRKIEYEIKKSLLVADLVTTTNEKLAEQIRRVVNTDVVVLPNAFPFGSDQFDKYKTTFHGNIIYAGGVTHLQDLKSISHFFGMCQGNTAIQNYKLLICGYNETNQESIQEWNRIIRVASIYKNIGVRNSVSPSFYMNHYNAGCISLAPLCNNEFNTYKSNLKTLEAGCKAIPILASAMHPYNVDDVKGVTLCKTQKDWYLGLLKYARKPELFHEDGEALYKYVKEKYNLTDVNKKRLEVYRNLINEK